MGLFTLLWWWGAGVIRNTNPLINFLKWEEFFEVSRRGGRQGAMPGTMLVSSVISQNLQH